MTDRQRVMRDIGKICDAATLVVAGDWLLAAYLTYSKPELEPALKEVTSYLALAFWIALLIGSFFRPKEKSPAPRDPSPRWSGVGVVTATGTAGIIYVARSSPTDDYLPLFTIAAATLVIAAVVWRFATLHASEIGEARFVND